MTTRAFNAIALALGALLLTAIVAIVWRGATEEEVPPYDGNDFLVTVDYVTHCQTMTAACYAAADAAMQGRVTKACLDGRPGRRAMARGAVTWLNAHVALHPLALEDGLARAVAAVWPRCRT
ncbi:MAG TPA: hypothetical protein VG889_06215 [Rhizomicrobium sp.]|nr:hypothetical protein [Rhizomicrobium sp.]